MSFFKSITRPLGRLLGAIAPKAEPVNVYIPPSITQAEQKQVIPMQESAASPEDDLKKVRGRRALRVDLATQQGPSGGRPGLAVPGV